MARLTADETARLRQALEVLDVHHAHFFKAQTYAELTAQPTPEDSRAWSQILISVLTGIPGRARQKGSDLYDGSDVKAANAWFAIDKVRFNGVIKAGTQSDVSDSMEFLDQTPYLFFVLWDSNPDTRNKRARIWVVRPQHDNWFRAVANKWYEQRSSRWIRSANFQLHPPVDENSDIFTNNCGDLQYPLLLDAEWNGSEYIIVHYNPDVLQSGECWPA